MKLRVLLLTALISIAAVCSAFAADDDKAPLRMIVFGDHPPYHAVDNGQAYGFDIDVVKQLSQRLNREIDVRQVDHTEVVSLIERGEVDAVLGITQSRLGQSIFDYSAPYLHHKTRIFIKENTDFVTRLADLRWVRVGVREGVDVRDFLKRVPGVNFIVEPNAESGLKNLMSGTTSVYLGDEYECDYLIQKHRLQGVTTLTETYLLRNRTIAVKKGNAELLKQINTALEEMNRDFSLQTLKDQELSRRITLSGSGRMSLAILLGTLALVGAILLISLIFNQKLANAVDQRTSEVQSEHAHFQNIFDHASDGIVILDPENFRAKHVNRAFEDMIGYSENELKTLSLADLEVGAEKSFADQIHRAYDSGENVLFETRLWNKRQDPVDLFIHAKTFPYQGVKMVEAIARDITQSKKIEAMKDTILQDVAHELKTPMAKLAMSLELLYKKIPKEDLQHYEKNFDVCNRSLVRLRNTIEGILNLSRLEANTVEFHKMPFVIQEVVLNVIHELQMIADQKKIVIQSQMPPTPIEIFGDMEMIRRLFVNLIHNAIKFTDKGVIQVSGEVDDQFVKIMVKDEGIGLDKEDLAKIFERFYQKSATYEGSGVGLTISQKIVAFHNGVIWAESDGPGKGATMNVLFPLYDGTLKK